MNHQRVKIGLIGAGRAGMIHARTFSAHVDDAEFSAVADPNAEAVAAAAAELGITNTHTDWHELLASDVDAVVVVTPTKFHRDIVVAAAEAGKHILCEKPMAMTVEECRDMNAAADKAGVVLQIGFMRRFDAGFQRAKKAIDDGDIGEVVSVRSLTHGPSLPQPWMFDLAASNGPLAEVSSHDIDTVRWMTGSNAASVYAVAGNYRSEDARTDWPDFYDTVVMTASMRNGTIGVIDGAQGVQYGYDAQVEILGTHGKITVGDLTGDRVVVHSRDKVARRDIIPSWTVLFKDAYIGEDRSFVQSIRSGESAAVTGEDGLRAVQMVAAGNESIRTGAVVPIPE